VGRLGGGETKRKIHSGDAWIKQLSEGVFKKIRGFRRACVSVVGGGSLLGETLQRRGDVGGRIKFIWEGREKGMRRCGGSWREATSWKKVDGKVLTRQSWSLGLVRMREGYLL